MKTTTLRDIVAEYAPEHINHIADKYIVDFDYRAYRQYGPREFTIREDWDTFAFDTETAALEFIARHTNEIREDVKSYLDPRGDITYTVCFAYKKVPCIVVAADTELDLDVGRADLQDGSNRVACYCYDEFLDDPDSIEYDNYEQSGSDPLV